MLICGDFPKAGRDAGSFFFSFQGTSIPPSHSGDWKKGVQQLWASVWELPPLSLACQPTQGVVNFWFSLRSRNKWRLQPWHSVALSVNLPSSFLFSSSLQFVKAAQDRSHSCLWVLLSSSLLRKAAGFLFLLAGKPGWRCSLSRIGCVCLVCLSCFNNFMEETLSEGITWT